MQTITELAWRYLIVPRFRAEAAWIEREFPGPYPEGTPGAALRAYAATLQALAETWRP